MKKRPFAFAGGRGLFGGSLAVCCFVLLFGVKATASDSQTKAEAAEKQQTHRCWYAPKEAVQTWQQWRFGLFIHWGPVSLTGKEISWSRAGLRRGHRSRRGHGTPVEIYDNLYKRFNPVKFNADEWVRIAQQAGMKYLVFTTKHHDGFCNFDSKLTDYKITSKDSPYGKDICRQLADACHRANFPLGWYYSPPDWHHPDYRNGARHAQYIRYLHGQIKELLTNYGKVRILWFDGLGGKAEDWDAERLFCMIRRLQPDILINNRCGLPGDFDTPEQRIGRFSRERPWETCMTLGRQWAWKPNDQLKSLKQCLQILLRVVGGDGNFLFNVGPMPDGRIEPRQVQRLLEMGQWLRKYGEGVYGTRGGPFIPGNWGASTCKDNHIWLFVMNWPEKGPLMLPPVSQKIVAVETLTAGRAEVKQTDEGIQVWLPQDQRDEIASVIRLTTDGSAFEIPPVRVVPSGVVSAWGTAKASNVFHNMVKNFGPEKALDGDTNTRWATDAGTHAAWLEVDLKKPRTVGQVVIQECVRYGGPRIQKFRLTAKQNQQWKTIL